MTPRNLRYISHGLFETGGYRHEMLLFETLKRHYAASLQGRAFVLRRKKWFRNVWGYLSLLLWAYTKASADINVVVLRCTLPAIWRCRFSKSRVIVVLHNYASDDGKSVMLRWYYRHLVKVLGKVNSPKVSLVTVSPFWKKYFEQLLDNPQLNIVVFPNLFDTSYYNRFITGNKRDRVHLGQYSAKNDPQIFELATQLHHAGWSCYFSTLDPEEAAIHNGRYEILYFASFDAYLSEMAESRYTVALPRIAEGWNRVAHESILVGTTVIGYDQGGLGDLLRESEMFIVASVPEAIAIITQKKTADANPAFAAKYDISKASEYLKALV